MCLEDPAKDRGDLAASGEPGHEGIGGLAGVAGVALFERAAAVLDVGPKATRPDKGLDLLEALGSRSRMEAPGPGPAGSDRHGGYFLPACAGVARRAGVEPAVPPDGAAGHVR
jgi:hypothetical protein